jgi:hypothetical protein
MRVSIADEVYSEQIEDETILLELKSGNYYGLDAVASRLWQLLQELGSTEAVVHAAQQEYDDVGVDELTRDVETLVRALATRGLVVLDGASQAS